MNIEIKGEEIHCQDRHIGSVKKWRKFEYAAYCIKNNRRVYIGCYCTQEIAAIAVAQKLEN